MNIIKENEYLTREILDAVLWANTLFRGKVIFCGSFGLVTQRKLERKISDIDCLTEENWYGTFFQHIGQYGIYSSNSAKFEVNGILVLTFKITAPNGIIVDVMFRADYAFTVNGVKSIKAHITQRDIYEGEIRIQKAEQIIEAKRNWVNKTTLWAAPKKPFSIRNLDKHQDDLEYIDNWTAVKADLDRRRRIIGDIPIPPDNDDIPFAEEVTPDDV